VLNAIASMGQLQEIERATAAVLGFVQFGEGHRYADFTPGTDKVAAYGIGALIAGKLAAKVGFFKVIWLAILAGKKLILMGLIAAAALFARFRKRTAAASSTAT
jgi:uncharacterized membrane-anchored protein